MGGRCQSYTDTSRRPPPQKKKKINKIKKKIVALGDGGRGCLFPLRDTLTLSTQKENSRYKAALNSSRVHFSHSCTVTLPQPFLTITTGEHSLICWLEMASQSPGSPHPRYFARTCAQLSSSSAQPKANRPDKNMLRRRQDT